MDHKQKMPQITS